MAENQIPVDVPPPPVPQLQALDNPEGENGVVPQQFPPAAAGTDQPQPQGQVCLPFFFLL